MDSLLEILEKMRGSRKIEWFLGTTEATPSEANVISNPNQILILLFLF